MLKLHCKCKKKIKINMRVLMIRSSHENSNREGTMSIFHDFSLASQYHSHSALFIPLRWRCVPKQSCPKHSLPQVQAWALFLFISLVIIIIFLHGLGRLTCSGSDAFPSFPGASTMSSSSRFVVQGVFRESGVVHFFKMVDPVLFVFGSHVLCSRDLQFFSYDFASYFV